MSKDLDRQLIKNKSHYILTSPISTADARNNDWEETDFSWVEKSRQLQARRWRKLRQQSL